MNIAIIKHFRRQSRIFGFCSTLSNDYDLYTGYPTPVTWRKKSTFLGVKNFFNFSSLKMPFFSILFVFFGALLSSLAPSFLVDDTKIQHQHQQDDTLIINIECPKFLMEVFFWKTDSFFYIWLNVKINLSFFEKR